MYEVVIETLVKLASLNKSDKETSITVSTSLFKLNVGLSSEYPKKGVAKKLLGGMYTSVNSLIIFTDIASTPTSYSVSLKAVCCRFTSDFSIFPPGKLI